jgi:hypothetical protein
MKHIKKINNIKNINSNSEEFICNICNKQYNSYNGLWKHKKKCIINDNEEEHNIIVTNNEIQNNEFKNNELQNNISKDEMLKFFINDYSNFKNLIVDVVKNNNELFKQNQEFQEKMFEVIKNSNSITNNMTNCNNNNFNLQFFLNETCKDAMNMSDFINSFELKSSDLERLGQDGYVSTMSRLIINKVRELDVEKRPIHCSDAKREIIYIKEDDVWVKDDEEKSKLRNAVNKIGSKNIGVLHDWQVEHPNYNKSNSPYNDTYLKIMSEVVGGRDTRGNENKVMKNIIKEVVIDKQQYIK